MTFGGAGGSLGSISGTVTIDIQRALDNLNQLETKVNNLSGVGGGALAPLTGAEKNVVSLTDKADAFGKKYQQVGFGLAGVGAAVGVAFGFGIGAAANFEAAMDGVGASLGGVGTASGITEQQMASLNDLALQIGQETAFSAQEAALAMDELAKAGQSAEQILGGSAQASVDLAAAIGVGIPDAAAAVARAMNVWQADVESGLLDAAGAADTLTAAVNGSATDLPDLSAGLRNVGPIAANLGMTFEDTAAAVAYFTNFGLKGADAGVSMARALENVANPTSEASAKLAELGIAAFDANGEFIGFPALMDQLNGSMAGMSDQAKLSALSMIFGAEAADIMGIGILQGGEALRQMETDLESNGQAQEQARQRMDNFKGSMEQFRGSLETLAITIGGKLIPLLRPVVDFATGLLNGFMNLPGPIQTAAAAIIGITGAMAGIAGAMILIGPTAIKMGSQMASLAKNLLGLPKAIRAVSMALRGLALANPWILAIAAAIALLYLAYKKNFLGFGDGVRKVAAKVKSAFNSLVGVFDWFLDTWKSVSDPGELKIVSFIQELGDAFDRLTGLDVSRYFDAVAGAIQGVADWVQRTVDIFNRLRDMGINPVSAALLALSAAFSSIRTGIEPIDAIISSVSDAFKDLAQAIGAFLSGDFGRGFSELGELAGNLLEIIGNLATMIPRLLIEAFQSIDWGALVSGIASLAGTLWEHGSDLIGSLYDGALAFWDDTLEPWLSEMGPRAFRAIPQLAEELLVKGKQLALGIWSGVTGFWNDTVKPWLADIGGKAFAAIPDLAEKLLVKGKQLALGVWSGITGFWRDHVVPWLGDLGTKAQTAVGYVWEALKQKGSDLINGMKAGMVAAWEAVKTWVDEKLQWLAEQANKAIDFINMISPGDPIDRIGEEQETSGGGATGGGGPTPAGPGSDFLRGSPCPPGTTLIIMPNGTAFCGQGGGASGIGGAAPGLGAARGAGLFSGAIGAAGPAGTQAAAAFIASLNRGLAGGGLGSFGSAQKDSAGGSGFAGRLAAFVTQAGQQGTAAGTAFQQALAQGFINANRSTEVTVNLIVSKLTAFAAAARTQGTTAGSNFQQQLAQGFINANRGVEVSLSLMRSKLSTFVTDARTLGTQAGSSFQQGISTGMNAAVNAVQTAISKIRTALDSIGSRYSTGYSIGYSMGQGINAGISAWTSAIAATAAAAVNNAEQAARNAVDAKSPSRKMMALGEDMGRGLVLGMDRTRADVMAAFGALMPGAAGAGAFGGLAVGGLGGGTVINAPQFFAVKSDEYAQLLAQAEMGADFARTFPAELAMAR